MKQFFFNTILAFITTVSVAQNHFPPTGDVGIGTATPTAPLSLKLTTTGSNGGIRLLGLTDPSDISYWSERQIAMKYLGMYVNLIDVSGVSYFNGGNVGIGTATPTQRLTVRMDPSTNGTGIAVQAVNYSAAGSQPALAYLNPAGSKRMYAHLDVATDTYNVANAQNQNLFSITQSGNAGIGVEAPTEKLAVNGKIRAKEIKVDNAAWPDFVFNKGYPLLSLEATGRYIRDKGHLPGIPSALEVTTAGINLGEMNARLLQKIEELTLHLIEKEKELKAEHAVNLSQESRLEKLDQMIKSLTVKGINKVIKGRKPNR